MSLVLVEAAPAVLQPVLDGFRQMVDAASSALPASTLPCGTRDCASDEHLQEMLLAPASADLGHSFGCTKHPAEIDTREGAIFGGYCQALREYVAALYGGPAEHGGIGLYLGSAGMGWHTNFARPGVRVYFTYNRSASSRFVYFREGATDAVVTVAEPAGWSVKSFSIPAEGAPLWHAVTALDYRLSVGLRVAVATTPLPITA